MIDSTNKNVTFAVPTPLMDEIRYLVKQGRKPSINSLVREALEKYLQDIKNEDLRLDMVDASNDPLFFADVETCAKSFRFTDKEGLPEW